MHRFITAHAFARYDLLTTLLLIISALAFTIGLVLYGSTKRKGRGQKTVDKTPPRGTSPQSPDSLPPIPKRVEPHQESDYLKRRLKHAIDLLFGDAHVGQGGSRYPSVGAAVRPEALREFVRSAGSQVEFGTVAQLQRLLSDSNYDAGQVSKLIATDPILSGKVLRLANSSAFGVWGKVDSIGHALMLIGISNVVNHLCFDTLAKAYSDKTVLKGHTVASLWQHATATSICALFVGYLFPEINKGKLYTMALLHDLGKFVMGDLPHLSGQGREREFPTVTDIVEEEALYGINHAEVGSMLLEGWQIPDSIAKPVELHHHPSSVSMKDLGVTVEKLHGTVVLYIADQLARVFTSADGEPLPVLPLHDSYRKLLDRHQLEQNVLGSPLTTEVRKALALTQHFGSSVPSPPTETVAVR